MKTFEIVYQQTHSVLDKPLKLNCPLDTDTHIKIEPDISDGSLWFWQDEQAIGRYDAAKPVLGNKLQLEQIQWLIKPSKKNPSDLRIYIKPITLWLAAWDADLTTWRSLLDREEVLPSHSDNGFDINCKTDKEKFIRCDIAYDKVLTAQEAWLEQHNGSWRQLLNSEVSFTGERRLDFCLKVSPPWHYTIGIDLGTSCVCIYTMLKISIEDELGALHINKVKLDNGRELIETNSKLYPSYVRINFDAEPLAFESVVQKHQLVEAQDETIPNIKMLALQSKVHLGDKEYDSDSLIRQVFATILGIGQSTNTQVNYEDLRFPKWVTDVRFSVPNIFNAQLFEQIYQPLLREFMAKRCNAYFLPEQMQNTRTTLSYVSESEAILLYYLKEHARELPNTSLIIVVDIGAGTTDLTLARVDNHTYPKHNVKIIGHTGLPMGGNYYDFLLAEALHNLQWHYSTATTRSAECEAPTTLIEHYKNHLSVSERERDKHGAFKEFVKDQLKPNWGFDDFEVDDEDLQGFVPSEFYENSGFTTGKVKPEFFDALLQQNLETSLGTDTLAGQLHKVTIETITNLMELCQRVCDDEKIEQLIGQCLAPREVTLNTQQMDSSSISETVARSDTRLILSGRASRFKPVAKLIEQYCQKNAIQFHHLKGSSDEPDKDSEDKIAVAMGTCLSAVYQLKKSKPNAVKTIEQEERTLFNVYVVFYEAGGEVLEIKPLYDCTKAQFIQHESWPLTNVRSIKVFSAYNDNDRCNFDSLDEQLLGWLNTITKIVISQFHLPTDMDFDNSTIEIAADPKCSFLFPVWYYKLMANGASWQNGEIFPPNGKECLYQPSDATYESLWPNLQIV